MKKLILLGLVCILMSTYLFAQFDINKDNFSFDINPAESIIVYGNFCYFIDGDSNTKPIKYKIDRPEKIKYNNGYSMIDIGGRKYYLIDVNGSFAYSVIDQELGWNKVEINDEFYIKQELGNNKIKSIIASSILTEKINGKYISYKPEYVISRLPFNKESLYFLPEYLPWVPDLSVDKNPYLIIDFDYNVCFCAFLSGFIDLMRPNLYLDNSRVKTIQFTDLNSGIKYSTILKDGQQYTFIDLPFSTKKLKIELIDYYEGNKYTDPCVASIFFSDTKNDNFKSDYGLSNMQWFIKNKKY